MVRVETINKNNLRVKGTQWNSFKLLSMTYVQLNWIE